METKRHIQLPNALILLKTIDYKAALIFLAIRSCYNKEKDYSLVSLDKLKELTGASKPTISKLINKLMDANVLKRVKINKCYAYQLPTKYKHFECFSYDFLKEKGLTFTLKAYLASIQASMYKDPVTKTGNLTMPDTEVSKMLKTSLDTVNRLNKQLEDLGILTVCKNKCKDMETGLSGNTKIFDLSKYHQDLIFILKAYGNKITENSEDIKALKERLDKYERQANLTTQLLREVAELKKQLKDKDKHEYTL